jgi:hypothetical protein
MADDQTGSGGGGGLFEGRPIAGIPRPLALGGALVLGAAVLVWWWKKKHSTAASSSASTTVITGSSSTNMDNAMLAAILKDWQQSPGSSSTATGTGGGTGGGGTTGPGSGAAGQGTSATGTSAPPTSPGATTTTNESGQMHGISLAQAQYLFDTGNQPYVFNPASNQYVRWSGMPVSGQTFYAGPLNWQDALKNGTIVGGTKGHPVSKSTPAKAPARAPAKKK